MATSLGNLTGKVALITGASSGIGAATAVLFSKLGATLALTGRKQDNLDKVGNLCSVNSKTKPLLLQADLVVEGDAKKVVESTVQHFGKLNILVNCAGILELGNIENTSLEQYDRMFNINVRSIYHLTMLAVPHIVQTKGNVVNVSSVNGIRAFPNVLAYNMSKSAVDQFTRCVALELAPKQVRVNSVNPGVTVTELQKRGGLNEEAYAKSMDEFQKHILQSNHVELVNTIDVSKSSLLDQLIQYDVISAGEEEEILTQKTRRDQNTKLLYIIKRRKKLSRSSDTYGLFRSALQEDYGFLASKLSEGSVSSGHVRESSYKCLYCLLLANLIPSDVTHHLFQEGLISDDDLDHLNDGKFPRLERVKSLLGLVESSGQTSIDFFILKLEKKYDFIASHSKQHKEETLTICFCQYIENDAIERTKLVFNKEIGKTFPNDKSLMKKCSNLWSTLFDLRERGDWKRHAEITDEAFRRFTDPDLLIMLYRSEMCVSTFYMNDSVKADKMFEKAKTILPETRMSNWHLSRILPLRINSLIKQNKQDEASKVLQEAHQTMDGLKPCLSTGAVYFFEAMFLASNLKSNPNGTKSQEISKRVKDCFITAILHYKKEKYFKIKSFLNQVYLFLALFCLGVDLNLKSEIQYISVKIISRDDIEIAGHYLNKYETECWEISTNWSQMLFYIARAEEHKHRKNFRKCLDYLKQAKYCADNGNFKEHEKFIDFNFEFVSQKIEQQKCHNEKDQLSVEMLVEEFLGGSDDESESQSESDA